MGALNLASPSAGCWGQKVFSEADAPLTRLPCVRGAGPQSGPEGSFVDFRDKLSTLQPQFVYKNNPPVALRATAPFAQGGLMAEHHSFTDPDNLLNPASFGRGGGRQGRPEGFCQQDKISYSEIRLQKNIMYQAVQKINRTLQLTIPSSSVSLPASQRSSTFP